MNEGTLNEGRRPPEGIHDHEDQLVKRRILWHFLARFIEVCSAWKERLVGEEAGGEGKNGYRNQQI